MCKLLKEKLNFLTTSLAFQYLDEDADYISVSNLLDNFYFINKSHTLIFSVKEGLQSVLRIGSAHNKCGPPNINIVQISHFSNSF